MFKRFVSHRKCVLENFYDARFGVVKKYTTESSSVKTSYFHNVGLHPLKYMTVGQALKKIATQYPEQTALISCIDNKQYTFAEILDKADRLASGLLNLGLSSGDRVAIWAPNYDFWYISKLAIARAGLICVALNPAYQPSELDYSLKKVDVRAIVMPETFKTQKYYEMVSNFRKTSSSLKYVVMVSEKNLPGAVRFDDLIKSSSESDKAEIEELQATISPDDGCNIQFTSGTTGYPKAAVVSHFSFVNCGSQTGIRNELDQRHRTICLNLPFFHIAGIVSLMHSVMCGSTLVLPLPHFSAEASINSILTKNCDVIYGTPNMYVEMVAKKKELNVEIPEIAFSVTGAAICTPKLVRDARKYLNIRKFRSAYGMTETTASGFQVLPDEHDNFVEEFVGFASDHIELKVIDRKGQIVPFGQPGELCIRGYCNMIEYWGDEEKTKEVMGRDNWLKTGDQFILYENGYGQIIGRLKEMIIRGGENLFPREIEDFLNTHPNVLESHVVGIPDEKMGEEVGAFIRLKDPSKQLTQHDVKEFCKGKIAHFKVPRFVYVVTKYPRTVSGKVQKNKFLEYFADEIKKNE
ncbi:CLUMA_CG007914, isoform A [Clunio marinus]|uniref:Medium-chain acyl-CoA ligase ACSF2, mitochondrial n=1 Tax=Clunio marinus TaxID=568069 RepID=A0A1J1I241_9DIPT|nr:CLUMA_CG007914, isoform A [Clunio marinus]